MQWQFSLVVFIHCGSDWAWILFFFFAVHRNFFLFYVNKSQKMIKALSTHFHSGSDTWHYGAIQLCSHVSPGCNTVRSLGRQDMCMRSALGTFAEWRSQTLYGEREYENTDKDTLNFIFFGASGQHSNDARGSIAFICGERWPRMKSAPRRKGQGRRMRKRRIEEGASATFLGWG